MSLRPPTQGTPSTATFESRIASVESGVDFDAASDLQEPSWDASLQSFIYKDPRVLDVRKLGAVGDGTVHLLSEVYGTLAAAQAKFPFVTSLSQSRDYAAIQSAMEYVGARGAGTVLIAHTGHNYMLAAADARTVDSTVCYFHRRYDNVFVDGQGPGSSGIYAATTNSAAILFFERKFGTLFGAGAPAWRPETATAYTLASPTVGTGDTTIGSYKIANAVASTGTFVVGQQLTGTGIPADSTVLEVSGSNVTISRPASAAGTGVPITGGYRAGASTVTTATPADAGNFAVGDVVFIKTGQLLGTNAEPDSEINIVRAIDAATGIVTLQDPLAKPYAKEYYVSGTTGTTSTAATANGAPFAIAKINDYCLRDIGFRNLNATNLDTTRGWCNGDTILGYTRTGNNITVAGYGCSQSVTCRVKDSGNTITSIGSGAAVPSFCYAYGSRDVECFDNTVISTQRVTYLHVHEGVARYRVRDNTIVTPEGLSTTNEPVISQRARAYGGAVLDNTLVNSSQGVGSMAIYADGNCTAGGDIDGNKLVGLHRSDAITTSAPGWKVGNRNRLLNGASVVQNVASRRRDEPFNLSGWLNAATDTEIILGTIPANAIVTEIDLDVTVAFNGTTPRVTLGIDTAPTAYLTSTDVSALGNKAASREPSWLIGTATWDPASVADGAVVSTTLTVTGAFVGDPVAVGFSIAVPAGALLVGAVTATNTVTVTMFNHTGGAVDLASGTLRATVQRPSTFGTSTKRYTTTERILKAYLTGTSVTTGKALISARVVPVAITP